MNSSEVKVSRMIALISPMVMGYAFTDPGQPHKKPNFLIIMTDQQAWNAVGYAGLKSIASDGYSLKGAMEGTESPKYDFAVSEWQWKNDS